MESSFTDATVASFSTSEWDLADMDQEADSVSVNTAKDYISDECESQSFDTLDSEDACEDDILEDSESELEYCDELNDSFYTLYADESSDESDNVPIQVERPSFPPSTSVHETAKLKNAASTPLYGGAEISVFHAFLLIFQFAVRHSLTTKAFAELLHLIAALLPLKAKTPKTVTSLKKFFVEIFPQSKTIEHWYCANCLQNLPSKSSVCM